MRLLPHRLLQDREITTAPARLPLLLAFACCLAAGGAAAQAPAKSAPEVTVDLSVLDALPPVSDASAARSQARPRGTVTAQPAAKRVTGAPVRAAGAPHDSPAEAAAGARTQPSPPANPSPRGPAPAPNGTAAPGASPASKSPATMLAALSPPQAAVPHGPIGQVEFAPSKAELTPEAQQELASIAERLKSDGALRLELVAHASGGEPDAIDARRISLARAQAVRAYLIGAGVASIRMDARALGNRSDGGAPGDRVELVLLSH